jgi:hypothetical protein
MRECENRKPQSEIRVPNEIWNANLERIAITNGAPCLWSAATCRRFGCLADPSVRQCRAERRDKQPGRTVRCRSARLTTFDGDKSPAESGDESPHSKAPGRKSSPAVSSPDNIVAARHGELCATGTSLSLPQISRGSTPGNEHRSASALAWPPSTRTFDGNGYRPSMKRVRESATSRSRRRKEADREQCQVKVSASARRRLHAAVRSGGHPAGRRAGASSPAEETGNKTLRFRIHQHHPGGWKHALHGSQDGRRHP